VTNELFVNAIIQKALFVAGLKEVFLKAASFSQLAQSMITS